MSTNYNIEFEVSLAEKMVISNEQNNVRRVLYYSVLYYPCGSFEDET